MTPRLMDRLTHLERSTVSTPAGRHLVFQVEGPGGTPTEAAIAFLRGRGHAIHEEDSVLVMLIPTDDGEAVGLTLCDLSPALLTEEARGQASPAVAWPPGLSSFTFHLDSAGGRS